MGTRGLKVHYFWFRLLTLGTNVVLAVETTVLDDSSAKIFVAGLSVLVNVVVRLYLSHRNGRSCIRGCCTRDEDDIQPEEAAAVSRLMGVPPISSSSSISVSSSLP